MRRNFRGWPKTGSPETGRDLRHQRDAGEASNHHHPDRLPGAQQIRSDSASLRAMRTPGANVTGIMSSVDGLPGKQVEIARELIPGLVRLGMLVNVSSPSAGQRPNVEMAARASNLELAPFEVRGPDDLDPTFQALAREKAEGLVVLQDTMFFSYRQRIAALAVAAKLPTVFGFRDHVDAGGLISYGVNVRANHRRAAAYVVEF